MLRRMFYAPGYYLYRKFSKRRKKFRFISKSHERGPALRVSLLFWFCACLVAAGLYGALPSREGTTSSSSLPAEALAPFPSAFADSAMASQDTVGQQAPPPPPALPSMAESAQLNSADLLAATAPAPKPEAQAGASVQAGSGPAAGGAASVSAPGTAPAAPGPGRLDGTVPPSSNPISVPRELIPPGGSAATGEKLPEAWLVIVESIPKSQRDKAEEAQARQRKKGVTLSIMDTDAYPRLKSGLWALALGPYDSKKAAENAAADIKPKVRDLMVRRGL
jgi:hypothetical protein